MTQVSMTNSLTDKKHYTWKRRDPKRKQHENLKRGRFVAPSYAVRKTQLRRCQELILGLDKRFINVRVRIVRRCLTRPLLALL